MQREESVYADDWLEIAERDLRRVGRLLEIQDPEAAGLYLQQAVEKFLKAFLLSRGWELRRIHDLEVLLNEAIVREPTLEEFREVCARITDYYMGQRYPLVSDAGPTQDEVGRSADQVQGLVEWLRENTRTK